MTAKCSRCGIRIFDERGQSWGTQLPGGDWICDDDCELGLSIRSDVCPNCEEPWPVTETIRADGSLGCPCQEEA